ncbi:MAG: hypothetical protein DRN11_03570 [Thermoplasmata archaeon]|nr:MAG: hypothetical protein DRN11_03570 [Thermoplasmata archaeon]
MALQYQDCQIKRCEIVLHELLHLRCPNHEKMFKTMLNVYLEKALNREIFGKG